MSLSQYCRKVLEVALGLPAVSKELADAVDAKPDLTANNTLSGNNTFSGTNLFTGPTDFKRIKASQGTALAANGSDVALSGGFGSTASVAVAAGSTDTRGTCTITSAGTGQGANPTATLTFKDGAFGSAPFAVAVRGNSGNQLSVPVVVSTTTTTLVIKLVGTPVAAETFDVTWHVIQ